MGYTESTEWILPAEDLPTHGQGDMIYSWVQAYSVVGRGASNAEKAQYLHDGYFVGSAWSDRVAVRFPLPKTPLTLMINGQEVTGDYEVQEITQADYLVALAEDNIDENIVYKVIPEGSED